MEANSLIHKPKKQKLNEEQGIYGNRESLISKLPDDVLLHILSFLSTKSIIRTSVLSKRWEFLWTSIPNLYFGKPLPANRTLHMNFVERALYLRDDSDIKGFFLNIDVQCDVSRVKSWITAAVRHNVQNLHIRLQDLEGQFSLPQSVFTCDTLKCLVLDIPCILQVPPINCFSNLIVLRLESVDDYTTQQLFSGLPILEVLYLMECRWGCLKVLRISAPKLHSLTITEADLWKLSDCDGLSDCDDHRDFEGCRIMIFGANIKCFFYTGEFLNEYWLYNSFSLERKLMLLSLMFLTVIRGQDKLLTAC
ncbi:putative FBD-associated F-box protein At5g56440 [Corylus avellana]|uniref:putative FBD-associated F-box protein At5g56440 n=1 Tax=Corylus avellana TaxID=13451 RepID=UPI00286D6343|nr:putative FBD-associated F-box protein At5g56440 [Corylus avellana]XP_059438666.1 putative FBD-associated F-box protein At5g56440 [Corylus avellana]